MSILTVKELREAIKGIPGNTVIFLGDDEEVNGIHASYNTELKPLSEVKGIKIAGRDYTSGMINEEFIYPTEILIAKKVQKINKKHILLIT